MSKLKINFSKKFRKSYQKSPTKVKKQFQKRLKIFIKNPFNPLLKNHRLTGKYKVYRSINITGDWRALFSTRNFKKSLIIEFKFFGTHSQLYG